MWLTAHELAEVNQAVTALLMDKRERLEHPELRPALQRLVLIDHFRPVFARHLLGAGRLPLGIAG